MISLEEPEASRRQDWKGVNVLRGDQVWLSGEQVSGDRKGGPFLPRALALSLEHTLL